MDDIKQIYDVSSRPGTAKDTRPIEDAGEVAPFPKPPDGPSSTDMSKYIGIKDDVLEGLPADGMTWVRYRRPDGKIVGGGLLVKNAYPEYLVLMNPYSKARFSCSVSRNQFFIQRSAVKDIKDGILKEQLLREYKMGRLQFDDE